MKIFSTYKVVGALFLSTLGVSTGCNKTPVASADPDPTVVSFSLQTAKTAAQSAAVSRAEADDEFLTFSMLGMFAGESPVNNVTTVKYSNIGYENPQGNSVWHVPVGAEPIYFPTNGAAMDFFAYHPYSAQTPTATSFTGGNQWVDYALPTVQSTKADLKTADLLWGKATQRNKDQGTVNLEFHHKLAKLSLVIKKGTDWGTDEVRLSAVQVSGANVLRRAKLDLLSGTLTPLAGETAQVECVIAPSKALSVVNEYLCDLILVPAPAQDVVLTFLYDNNGGQAKATLSSGLSFKSGTQLKVQVTVNKLSPTEISVSPTMGEWKFVSQVEVEGI